jgi:hypothetical protein
MKKLLLLTTLAVSTLSFGQSVTISPTQDNSIYSESINSNGLGDLYSGNTCSGNQRRAFLQFDITANVPVGATITSVQLDLNCNNVSVGASSDDYTLHAVNLAWGEGTSNGGGTGAVAVAPDATWIDAMFGTSTWTAPGGDFNAASATTTLPALTGAYAWTSPLMISDVQSWLDAPASNFGWVLIGNESTTCTARRFGSKDQGTAPQLIINYTCTTAPNTVCQNINAYLDGTGNITINDADLDGGSSAVCGTSLTFSASQTAFTCADILVSPSENLVLSAVYDGPLPGGLPKGIELYVINDIADLSEYGVGSATNGGGTDGEEFTFPAVTVTAGTYIYIASEAFEFANWFGFAPDYTDGSVGINGDDAIEVFHNGAVIDVFGDINLDGTGQPWEYLDGWAYRNASTGPDGSIFTIGNWNFSGTNALDGESDNGSATSPIPIGTYTSGSAPGPTAVTLTVTDNNFNSNTCVAMVSVLDTVAPVVNCVGAMTIVLNSTGDTTLLATDLDNGSADACGIDTLYLSKYDFTCLDAGLNIVTLYAEDIYGNIDSCFVSISIDQSDVITVVTDSVTNASCLGQTDGGVYISYSGGTGPHTFDWDNDGTGDNDDTEDLENIGAGAYLVVVTDANGCTAGGDGLVTEPAGLSYTTADINPTCNGLCDGMITITPSAGPVTYSIDNGATFQASDVFSGLCAGTYDIVVDNGSACQATGQVTLLEPLALVLSIENDTICAGDADGELELIFTGGIAPFIYDLDGNNAGPVYPGLAIGGYDGMVTDANGCLSNTVSAEVLAADAIDVTVSGLDTCVYTANQAGATYQWIRCDDSTAIVGATEQFYDLAVHGGQGEIAVVITNAFGCSDTSECLPTEFVGFNQLDGQSVAMFPNPTSQELTIRIEGNSDLVRVNLLDMNGRVVYSTATSNMLSSIDVSTFENGVYLVELISNEMRMTQRVVVQH